MTFAKIAAAMAVVTTLSGCLSGVDGGPLIRPGEPTGAITVNNRSFSTLTAVTISACENFTHGFNRLPSGVVLNPGQSYTWRVSAGCWDVQAGFGDGSSYSIADFRENVRPGQNRNMTVLN